MKISYLILLAALFFTSCEKKSSTTTAPSSPSPVKLSEAPGNFIPSLQEVSAHLDTNGQHFAVTDIDGDLDSICQILDGLTSNLDKKELNIPQNISFRKILKESGFGQITAKGQSSRRVDNHWHNRSYYAISGKRKGILSLLGDKSAPFVTPNYAPANADFVFETQLKLKQIYDLAQFVAKSFGPEAEQEVKSNFEQQLMNSSMTLADMLGKFDIHFSMAITMDNQKTWKVTPNSDELPTIDLIARFDNAHWIWEQFGKDLEKAGELREENGLKYILAPEAIPSPMGKLRPLIVVDPSKDQIWFALSEDSFKASQTDNPKLKESASFQTAISGLPKEGNTLAYVSTKFCTSVTDILQKTLAQEADPEWSETADSVITQISKALADNSSGYAFALAQQKKGILVVANSPISSKGSSLTSGLPLTLTATSTLFFAGRAYKKAADRAACILNIRNIQQAMRANMNLEAHEVGEKINWDDIIGTGKFLELEPRCPLHNQRYILSEKYPPTGKAAAKCPNAQSENHKPKSTVGW